MSPLLVNPSGSFFREPGCKRGGIKKLFEGEYVSVTS